MEVRHKEEFGEDAFKGCTHDCKLIEQKYKPDYDKENLDMQDTEIGYTRGILNKKVLGS